MKPLNALLVVLLVFIFARNMINQARAEYIFEFDDDILEWAKENMVSQARADDLFNDNIIFGDTNSKSDFNSFYKDDGSVVNIYGAEESGIAIKDGEVEYYVVPKDNGEPTFIYDDELIICTNTGCY